MALPYQFANATSIQTPQLDDNFDALGALTPVVCTATGTNTVTLTIAADNPTVASLADYMPFTFVAVGTNTSAVKIAVGSIGALSAYKDSPSGPVAFQGGELVAGNLVLAIYDSALDAGAGGFHVFTNTAIQGAQGAAAAQTGAAGATITAAQLTGTGRGQGILVRSGPTAAFTDTTDTAANIFGAISGAVIGTIFRFRVINNSSYTQTLAGGTDVTIAGPATTAASASHDFIGLVTVAGATPAVTIYG